MAVRPVPSIPSVTCSAVDDDENPEDPFLLNGHIFCTHSLSHTRNLQNLSHKKKKKHSALHQRAPEIEIQVTDQRGYNL